MPVDGAQIDAVARHVHHTLTARRPRPTPSRERSLGRDRRSVL